MLNGQSLSFSSATFSASASLIDAEPGLSGFGWLLDGAQPVKVINSKVASISFLFEFWLLTYLSDIEEKSFR